MTMIVSIMKWFGVTSFATLTIAPATAVNIAYGVRFILWARLSRLAAMR
jgi:hypothetical protein